MTYLSNAKLMFDLLDANTSFQVHSYGFTIPTACMLSSETL